MCAGKTVVLFLQGLRWLHGGHDVHVISWRHYARAASAMLAQQLDQALAAGLAPRAGRVIQHRLASQQDARNLVTSLGGQRGLHVIIDEAGFGAP